MICVAILSGGGVYLWQNQQQTIGNTSETADELAKVHLLYDQINQNYYESVDSNTLIEGALKGMTEALGDPYTSYLTESEAQELNQSLSDSFEGIGASLSLSGDYPIIAQAPIKDTPAQKAGLRVNDVILKVDGNETKGVTLAEVVSQIRGEKGSKVTLEIQRGEESFEVELIRDTIPIETVSQQLDETEKNIGRITITSFGEGTTAELQKAITTLRQQGATSFIIDVRQNPGGLLDQVEYMASMFLEDGKTIVKFADNTGVVSETKASSQLDQGFKVTEPVVVLVDSGSASAAEIFAAALKESADIPIVGTNTFGKGTVQNVKELGENSELKMTIGKWLTPNEEWVNEGGLAPTYTADFPAVAYLPPLPRDSILKEGQSSDSVNNLNQFLQALGYETQGDVYSEATTQAVKAFQKAEQLSETGQVDEETAQKIETAVMAKIKAEDQAYLKARELLTNN